jgi:hypothetical protein
MEKGMLWKNIPGTITNKQFRRLTGVRRNTFGKMSFIIKTVKTERRKHPRRGSESKLCIEDQLLMLLMYYREYRTFLHIGTDYGMSEAQCWRIVTDLENILIQSKAFCLPGKKALTKSNAKWSLVLVDVGESSVERPKKNSGGIIQAKRKSTPIKHS